MEMKKKFLKLAFIAIFNTFLILSCSSEEPASDIPPTITQPEDNIVEEVYDTSAYIDTSEPISHDYDGQYSFSVFQNEDQSWGYEILDDSNTFILQKNIPAIPGKKGFSTEARAEKTASFVIYKLEQGYFPPSLNKNELDSLGVID